MWGSSNVVARKNPFLETHLLDMWECYSSPEGQGLLGLHPLLVSAEIKTKIFNSEVWPEMYLTSPPCTGVTIIFEYTEEFQGRHTIRFNIFRSIYDPTGVTFGTLLDALQKEGEVRVWRDYKPLSEECYDPEQVMNTTVQEQIELHRRKGIKVSLNRERSNVESYSIAVLATDREDDGTKRDDNGGWGPVQASEW
jgi:hypothetical protein